MEYRRKWQKVYMVIRSFFFLLFYSFQILFHKLHFHLGKFKSTFLKHCPEKRSKSLFWDGQPARPVAERHRKLRGTRHGPSQPCSRSPPDKSPQALVCLYPCVGAPSPCLLLRQAPSYTALPASPSSTLAQCGTGCAVWNCPVSVHE